MNSSHGEAVCASPERSIQDAFGVSLYERCIFSHLYALCLIFLMCMCVYVSTVWGFLQTLGIPEAGVTDDCEIPDRFWELNSGQLKSNTHP